MAVAEQPASLAVVAGHGTGAAVQQRGPQHDSVHVLPFCKNVGRHGGEGHVGHIEIRSRRSVPGQYRYGVRFRRLAESAGPPDGQQCRFSGKRRRNESAVSGKGAAQMSGDKMLKTIRHAVAFPWAQPQSVGQRKSRASAEADIAASVSDESPHGFRSRRSESLGLASRRTSGYHEHLARQTGLGYV